MTEKYGVLVIPLKDGADVDEQSIEKLLIATAKLRAKDHVASFCAYSRDISDQMIVDEFRWCVNHLTTTGGQSARK